MRRDGPDGALQAGDVAENWHATKDDLAQRLTQLPDGHPSADSYRSAERGSLSEAEWSEHIADVADQVEKASQAGLASDVAHTLYNDRKSWTRERVDRQNEIIDALYEEAANVPNDGKAVIAGGLAGAGKTTVLGAHAGIDRSQYLTISADDIKEKLAERGLIPEVDGLSPMEASELVHVESSYIASRLAGRARDDGKNLIWDITMSSAESVERRVDDLQSCGYERVEAVFVDLPLDVSLRRADSRYREGQEKYWAGEGQGGRYMPPAAITNQSDPEWGSKNRRAFEEVKHRFDSWMRFDNGVDGRAPALVDTGSRPNDPEESNG